jgi:hypothetical protein
MMPRIAITQIAKIFGRELESDAGPSEEVLAAGAMLAAAGATTEIVGRLLAEAHRKRPNERIMPTTGLCRIGVIFLGAPSRRGTVVRHNIAALGMVFEHSDCERGCRQIGFGGNSACVPFTARPSCRQPR